MTADLQKDAPINLLNALTAAAPGAMKAHLDAQSPEEFALRYMQGLRRVKTTPRWMVEIGEQAFVSISVMSVQRDGPLGDGMIIDGLAMTVLRGAHRINSTEVGQATRAAMLVAQHTGLDTLVMHYTVVTESFKMPAKAYAVTLDDNGELVGASAEPQGPGADSSGAFIVLEVHTTAGCARAASQVVDGRTVGPVWVASEGRSTFAAEVRKARVMHAEHGEVL